MISRDARHIISNIPNKNTTKPHANIRVSPFERNINDIFRYSTTKIALVIYTDIIIVATLYQKHTLQIISTHQVKK